MLLDDALRGTLRNFSTLFLVLFTVIGPLHLVYGFAFQDVLALRELHPAIADFPPSRQVRGVGRAAVDQARLWLWVVVVIELALLPVFARLAAHIVTSDNRGEVPTALGAWRRLRGRPEGAGGPGGHHWGTVAAGVLVGVAIGFMTEATLMIIADLVPDSAAFAAIALARAVGHCAGGAFALGALVYAGSGAHQGTPDEVPELY